MLIDKATENYLNLEDIEEYDISLQLKFTSPKLIIDEPTVYLTDNKTGRPKGIARPNESSIKATYNLLKGDY